MFGKGPNTKKIDKEIPRLVGDEFSSVLKSKRDITYDEVHDKCAKCLLYFISRICVLYDFNKREQSFY